MDNNCQIAQERNAKNLTKYNLLLSFVRQMCCVDHEKPFLKQISMFFK